MSRARPGLARIPGRGIGCLDFLFMPAGMSEIETRSSQLQQVLFFRADRPSSATPARRLLDLRHEAPARAHVVHARIDDEADGREDDRQRAAVRQPAVPDAKQRQRDEATAARHGEWQQRRQAIVSTIRAEALPSTPKYTAPSTAPAVRIAARTNASLRVCGRRRMPGNQLAAAIASAGTAGST